MSDEDDAEEEKLIHPGRDQIGGIERHRHSDPIPTARLSRSSIRLLHSVSTSGQGSLGWSECGAGSW